MAQFGIDMMNLIKRCGLTNLLMCVALLGAVILTLLSFTAKAQEAGGQDVPLAEKIESLKKDLIALNRDLFVLEEDLLFPSSTQVAVYLAVDVGHYFRLDAVELKIDDKTVANHLYTDRQVEALKRGGVQRLYIGNLNQGEHELTAFYIGMGPEERPYKRAVTLRFNKDSDAKAVQLDITDSGAAQQPEFHGQEL
ncbi:hypothetical protein P2G88_06305 [Aliiglaciecola sp. CAU 1673]|uniref:hypothetical protein n=1 Tax=Aliiglaciecola sp. CAU 1673 TaxID=3032595 RepID=UPI0023DB84D1|nr:hypothetical protein [Aliiglaciecola sp. CAU 1673]MDF2177858.1 hypothetical protein [Aliiglaciecola sp. CAU 1673]